MYMMSVVFIYVHYNSVFSIHTATFRNIFLVKLTIHTYMIIVDFVRKFIHNFTFFVYLITKQHNNNNNNTQLIKIALILSPHFYYYYYLKTNELNKLIRLIK